MHNYSMSNNSFRGYDFLFGGDRNESHGCLVARQNRWAAYGQSSPRWTTLTGSPRNRKAIYRFSAPPKDSRYRLIGTERIIVDIADDMRASSNEKSRGGDDSRNFLKNFSFFSFGKKRSDGFLGTCCVLLRTGGQRPAKDPLDGRCAWIEERGEREPGFDMPCTGVPGSFEQVEK